MAIQDKAMIATLQISHWTGRGLDRKVTQDTNSAQQAVSTAGSYYKAIIGKSDLKPIQNVISKARSLHRKMTLPWGEKDDRIIPGNVVMQYTAEMRQLEQEFHSEVNTFMAKYPGIISSRQTALGLMYNPKDYPHPTQIQKLYSFKVSLDPVASADDVRMKLNDMEIQRIKDDVVAREKESYKAAMDKLWERLYNAVKRVSDKLNEPVTIDPKTGKRSGGIFQDTMISNMVELAGLLPDMNIDDDDMLNEMCEKVKNQLCIHDPNTLRKNPKAREDARQAADDLLTNMAGYTGGIAA